MNADTLHYEVQRIDGTPASIVRAIELILSELNLGQHSVRPSTEIAFFEEAHKAVLDWVVVEDGLERMKEFSYEVNKIIASDRQLMNAFAGLGPKHRFGVKLACLRDFVETYIASDTYAKTYMSVMRPSQQSLRRLLVQLHRFNKPALEEELGDIFSKANSSENELQYLIKSNLVRKDERGDKVHYELAPNAFDLMQREENRMEFNS